MKVSVLIPVSDDLRILDCINSIDEKVEVVISLNKPSKELRKLIDSMLSDKNEGTLYKDIMFKVCEINYVSIAGAYNNGIKHSKYNNVLLMDSDCVFKKGCIKKLHKNIKGELLSKGRLLFGTKSFSTRIVARAREFHSTDVVSAYSPPLLFKKSIVKHIGGFYFHPSLCWLEDSEFDNRVNIAKLNIAYDESANVVHAPLTIVRDLRSAFWYGVGKRIGVELGIHDKPTGLMGSMKKYLIVASKRKGYLSGCYLFAWKMTLLMGYYVQRSLHIRPKDMLMIQKEN